MKKMFYLILLSVILIPVGLQAQQCSCEDLLAGDTCCITSQCFINGCEVQFEACLSIDNLTGYHQMSIRKMVFPDTSCYNIQNMSLLDWQDSLIVKVMEDTTVVSDSCWPGIAICPNNACLFKIEDFVCFKEDYQSNGHVDEAALVIQKNSSCDCECICYIVTRICRNAKTGEIEIDRYPYNNQIPCPSGCKSICN